MATMFETHSASRQLQSGPLASALMKYCLWTTSTSCHFWGVKCFFLSSNFFWLLLSTIETLLVILGTWSWLIFWKLAIICNLLNLLGCYLLLVIFWEEEGIVFLVVIVWCWALPVMFGTWKVKLVAQHKMFLTKGGFGGFSFNHWILQALGGCGWGIYQDFVLVLGGFFLSFFSAS